MRPARAFDSRLLESGSFSDFGTVDVENPWPGLASFREADRDFFRGREQETDALERLVMRERLTVVFGLSGLGKTSLLKAGLFPRLRRQQVFPVHIRLNYADGASNFTAQVRETLAREAEHSGIEAPASRDGDTLWEVFHRRDADFWTGRNRLAQPFLVFDQFEEMFTLGASRGAGVGAFLTELADLIEGRPPAALKARLAADPTAAKEFAFSRHRYKVLLSLREDFLPDLEGLRQRIPALAHNRLRLRRMDGQAALSVVQQVEGLVSDEVAGEVIRFVAAAEERDAETPLAELEVEPALLSVVCRELNLERLRRRDDRQITSDLLEGSREDILSNLWERSVADVRPKVRAFIEDRLLTVSGHRDSVALDNALSAGVTIVEINLLINGRLLRLEERDGVRRIELTHDLLTKVIRDSRDRRREFEERAEAEAEFQQEQARAEAALRKLRRSRFVSAAFVVLALLAIAGAIWGLVAQREARQAQRLVGQFLARSHLAAATSLVEDGRPDHGLAHLARAVEAEPDNVVARSFLLHLLLYQRWPSSALPHEDMTAVELSADGKRLITASWDQTTRIWDVETGTQIASTSHDDVVLAAAFDPDGERVVTSSYDGTAQLWKAADWTPIGKPMRHESTVVSAIFDPAGERVVTASDDGTAHLWKAADGAPIGKPMRHQAEVTGAIFIDDGRRVVTASKDGTARLWDAATGESAGESMGREEDGAVLSLALDSTGERVFTVSTSGVLKTWRAADGVPIEEPTLLANELGFATFGPGGAHLLTETINGTGQIWSTETRSPIGRPVYQSSMPWNLTVNDAAFSADGKHLVTASDDGSARIWLVATGTAEGTADAEISSTMDLDVNAGERRIDRSENRARILGLDDQQIGETMLHHSKVVLASFFSPGGERVVTTTSKTTTSKTTTDKIVTGEVWLWNAATGEPIGEPLQTEKPISSLASLAGGQRLVAFFKDGTAWIWDTPTGTADAAGRMEALAEAVGGYAVNEHGSMVPLDPDDRQARLDRLAMEATGDDSSVGVILRWFFADPATRTPSPLSKLEDMPAE